MTSTSALRSVVPFPLLDRNALASPKSTSSLQLPPCTSPSFWQSRDRKDSFQLTSSTMSGYYHQNPDAPSLSEEDAFGLFYQGRNDQSHLSGSASGLSYPQQQQWGSAGYSAMSYPQNHPPMDSYVPPSQYVSWPSASLPPLPPSDYARSPYQQSSTPVVPSTPYASEQWANAPWPALHPDDVEASSSNSRSVSPNPADLHNFGIPLSDGKSWKCAYKGCTSQARFTRGCDLRKHFRRHTKSLFCRHEDCPQSKEGGFSSRKDRDRHESRHKPGVMCSHPGCERLFSRVDNMKDHVRRIHEKKT